MRTQKWDTHEATGPWIPLASAPVAELPRRLRDRLPAPGSAAEIPARRADRRRRARRRSRRSRTTRRRTASAAPGRSATSWRPGRSCSSRARHLHRHRLGRAGRRRRRPTACRGPSTTASFGVDVHVAPSLAGSPLSFRAVALPGDPFVGVRAPAPPGGQAEVRCALTARSSPTARSPARSSCRTGSAPTVPELVFPRPGAWTCVARGTAEGQDENFDTTVFATPWSGAADVRGAQRLPAPHRHDPRPRSKRPRFTFIGRVAGRGEGRPRHRDAVPRHRLPRQAASSSARSDLARALRRQADADHDAPPAPGGLLPRPLRVLRGRTSSAERRPEPDAAAGAADRVQFVRRAGSRSARATALPPGSRRPRSWTGTRRRRPEEAVLAALGGPTRPAALVCDLRAARRAHDATIVFPLAAELGYTVGVALSQPDLRVVERDEEPVDGSACP